MFSIENRKQKLLNHKRLFFALIILLSLSDVQAIKAAEGVIYSGDVSSGKQKTATGIAHLLARNVTVLDCNDATQPEVILRSMQGIAAVSPYAFSGADVGGGRAPPPQGFDPLPTQRVPPLVLFKKSNFGRPTLKFF